LLGRLGGDDALVVEGVVNLRPNGAPAAGVVDAVARTGARLDDLVARRAAMTDTRRLVTAAGGSRNARDVCGAIVERV